MLGFQQFNEYKDEINFLINHGFHIPRKDMPQIKDNNRESFLKYLDDNKIKHEHKDIVVGDYKITQGEIDLPKVLSIISKGSKEYYPLIVSNDFYILDGHHRFCSKYLMSHSDTAEAIIIDLPIVQLLRLCKEYNIHKEEETL